jgi:hypothetical protein
MTDSGSVPGDRSATGDYMNNIVLSSSFVQARPGSAVRNIDEMRALLQETNIDVLICISESWFKKHHSDKSVSITGYKLLRADRRDGRRGGGTAMYVRSELRIRFGLIRFGFGWLLKVMFL